MLSALSLLAGSVYAQNEYDAIRFSQTYIQGSARSAAMGGAFGALGGDASVLAINPAGIGVFSDPDLSYTLDFMQNEVKTSPSSVGSRDTKSALKISNLSLMIPNDNGNSSGFTGWTFGIAYNRLNDFSHRDYYNYINPSNSMLDSWCDRANGKLSTNLSKFNTGLAFDAYLIDEISDDAPTTYCNPHENSWSGLIGGYGERQRRKLETKGGINSWDFAVASSFHHRFFLGASLGVNTINYKANSNYSEDDETDVVPYDYWDFVEKNEVHGTGANLKIGLLAKPVDWFSFGVSLHTPTFYTIHDKYYSKLHAQYDEAVNEAGESYFEQISPNNSFDYKLQTPFKYVLSAALIAPSYTVLSFDYERLDYSNCELNDVDFNDSEFYESNEACRNNFQSVNNMRVGLEQSIENLAFRFGYAMYGNPYKFVTGDKQRQILSAGISLKHLNGAGNVVYFDITGTYHIYQTDGYLYESVVNPKHSQRISYDNRYLNIMLTMGVRFR